MQHNQPVSGANDKDDQQPAAGNSQNNPFENKLPLEQDIARSQETLDKEQQFKEAQTERD